MRHRQKRHHLNRRTSWRKATLISLVKNLLNHQSIRTTKARALAVRPLAEKLIALAKKNTVNNKRQAYKILGEHGLVCRLFADIGPRFTNRPSGCVRMLNLGQRRGDGAELAVFELTEIKQKQKKPQAKEKKTEVPKAAEMSVEETKPKTEIAMPERHPEQPKKPTKKFLGGLRKIFKRERDSL